VNHALNAAVQSAAEELFGSVVGVSASFQPPVEMREDRKSQHETTVVISFVGTISGAFALRCSTRAASRIATQMLGTPVAEGSDDMKDAVGEFFNMLVGTAKTKYATAGEPFRISVPTTVIGESYVLHIKANDADALTLIEMGFEAERLSIEIYLK